MEELFMAVFNLAETESDLTFATRKEHALPCTQARLDTVGFMFSKMIIDSSINGRCIILFNKFSRLRVN